MSTFRLMTLNVHSFRNPSNYDSNISDLVSILEPLQLDLIAVQEIQNNDKWQKFSSRLCEYFKKIVVDKREDSQWEKPRFDLTNIIRNEWNYQDAFKLINPEKTDEEVVTCDYGTRIDYIYVHPRVYDQWTLTKCEIIDTKGATDHNGVLAEFMQKSK